MAARTDHDSVEYWLKRCKTEKQAISESIRVKEIESIKKDYMENRYEN